jgi:hypothetical protein
MLYVEFCELNTTALPDGEADYMRISIGTLSQNATCDVSRQSSGSSSHPSASPSASCVLAMPSLTARRDPTSAFPTGSAFLCDDTDGEFFVDESDQPEPCIWLQARSKLIPEYCAEGSEASLVCPKTCGACTDECKDTRNSFIVRGIERDCGWLRIRPGQQAISCVVGSDVYLTCPETCDACDGRDHPSSAPSSQGDTKSPTSSPTKTVSPTDARQKETCDDDPIGRFPVTSLGTSEPCIWLSDRPQYNDEVCVEGLPAWDLCEEVSNQIIAYPCLVIDSID